MSTNTSASSSRLSLSPLPSIFGLLAALIVFVALRASDGPVGPVVGLALAAVAFVARAAALMNPGDARALVVRAVIGHGALVVGGGLVFVASVDGGFVGGDVDAKGMLTALGLLLAVAGTAIVLVLELLMAQTRQMGFVDAARVARAGNTAVTVVAGIAMLAGIVFSANKADVRFELAYQAPTSPSGATLALVDAAACGDSKGKPEVFLFFERGSTAVPEILDYFKALEGKGVSLVTLDQALDPALAKALKVTKNGTVGLRCGGKTETWSVGAERDDAQKKLPKLDEEVRTRLAKITRDPVNVYFTVGHGERSVDESDKSGRAAAKNLKKLLEAQNVKPKKLGIGDGLSSEVPKDAGLVVVLGPTQPFLAEEVRTLVNYVDAGGAVAVFVDPAVSDAVDGAVDVRASLAPLFDALNVSVGGAELVNSKEYVKQSGTSADHVFVFATSFGSHKAVKTLNGARGKAALLFQSSQAVARKVDDKAIKVSMIARTRPATWTDTVKNRSFDEGSEKKDILDFAGVVEKGEGRALVVGDSDVVADVLLANEANAVFAYEAFAWLLRDDKEAGGPPTVSEDTPIRHTRDEDSVWFYGTVFGGPVVVFSAGMASLALRRRRRAPAAPATTTTTTTTKGGAA